MLSPTPSCRYERPFSSIAKFSMFAVMFLLIGERRDRYDR